MSSSGKMNVPTASELGIMQGSPPPSLLRVTLANWLHSPFNRWSYLHAREMVPTVEVPRGETPPSPLPPSALTVPDDLRFDDPGGSGEMTVAEMLEATWTDGFLVLHRGEIVREDYRNGLTPKTAHLLMSVSKSFTGTLAAVLAHEGAIDPEAPVIHYLPELAGSAYADATVRQVMDMTISVQYSEEYADPHAEIWDYSRAMGLLPRGPGDGGPASQYDFLVGLQKERDPDTGDVLPHGRVFGYKTVNTDVLAWIVRRVTGRPLAALLSERFWSKLGCEEDAYYIVDPIGTEFAGGGLNAALRDLGRFGLLMLRDGRWNGEQLVPAEVIEDIRTKGDRKAFDRSAYKESRKHFAYRNQWWVDNDHHAYSAIGVYGQRIYVSPEAETVIVKVSSFPEASNVVMDQRHTESFAAIARHLKGCS